MAENNQYYKEIAVLMRKDSTCSVEAYLDLGKNIEKPLFIHEPWSRFKLTLIDKKGESKKVLKGNIPVNDVEYIQTMIKTHLTLKTIFLQACKITNMFEAPKKVLTRLGLISDETQNALPKCYTLRFKSGNGTKGRTPAELALESDDTKKLLIAQRDFLIKHLQQYPDNREMIDAINEAITLYKEKKLDAKLVKSTNTSETKFFEFPIYHKDFKYVSETDESGRNFSYSISLYCDYTRENSWRWVLKNCFATVTTRPDGTKSIDIGNAVNKKMTDFYMTDEEMVYCINRIAKTLQYFEHYVFGYQYSKVQNLNEFFYPSTNSGNNSNNGDTKKS